MVLLSYPSGYNLFSISPPLSSYVHTHMVTHSDVIWPGPFVSTFTKYDLCLILGPWLTGKLWFFKKEAVAKKDGF